jgi:hypothetical protein
MGNGGRLSGRGGAKRIFVGGAILVLSVAALVMLTSGSRGYSARASVQVPAAPLAAALKSSTQAKPDAQALLSHLPMIFEANQGQASSDVKFVSRGQGYSVYLDETGAILTLRVADEHGAKLESVRMNLLGANPAAKVEGGESLPGTSNYFIGNDPKKWHRGVPQFAGVRYQSVYPGIDLVFYGNQGRLEYDFKVAPGADPAQAELQFEGASKLELSGGDLILNGTASNVRLQAPKIYQRIANREQAVKGQFVLRGTNRVGFEVGAYDHSRELVIDPTISYSTYFGGSATTSQPYVAVNGNGFIYLTGSTTSPDLPVTTNATQATLNGAQNIFILELDPAAGIGGVVYLTYLGGSGTDTAAGIAADSGGNVYVAGTTTSTNFPSINGYTGPAANSATSHVFVSKISQITSTVPTLPYSTVLAGNGTDVASGMTVDSKANVFVTGTTTSTDAGSSTDAFPATILPPAQQKTPSPGSTIQFFVTEVNTQGIGFDSVAYSTYFGGGTPTGAIAIGGGITVDTVGNVYFTGTTNFYNSGEGTNGIGGLVGTDFPISNAAQPCLDTSVLTILNTAVSCTPPATTPYPTDAFVAKLNPANAQTGAQQLLFSTYLGGTQADSGAGITIDTGAAGIYITGSTNSSDIVIPTGSGPFQLCLNTPVNPAAGTPCTAATPTSPTDAYVAKFTNPTEASGTTTTAVGLSYFSYLGGTLNDSGLAIAVDPAAGALVTGATNSTDFPVSTGAIQSHLNGTQNAFFGHINTTTVSGTNTVANYATYFGGNGVDRGTSITLDSSLNTYLAGDTTSTNLQVQGALQPVLAGSLDAFALKLQTASDLSIQTTLLNPASGVQGAGNPVTMTFTVTNGGPDLATNVIVTGVLNTGIAATFNPATAASGTCSTPSGTVVVCTIPTLQSGSTVTVEFSVTPTQAGAGSVTATVTSSNNTNTQTSSTAAFQATNYTVGIAPASQTVVAGGVATYFVSVSPFQSYGNTVSLSCSSLPVGASCGFSPTSLTFNGASSQTATLNLTTTSRPPVTISSSKRLGPAYAFWLMLPGMALAGLGSSKRGRRRLAGWIALALLFAFFALQPACSKTKQQATVSGTPAGSYPLTVTATSGTYTVNIGFSLTVQ